jgi:hypothetical protein
MTRMRQRPGIALCFRAGAAVAWTPASLMGQVQTEVPPVVPNAKPVTVEHIRVHSALPFRYSTSEQQRHCWLRAGQWRKCMAGATSMQPT